MFNSLKNCMSSRTVFKASLWEATEKRTPAYFPYTESSTIGGLCPATDYIEESTFAALKLLPIIWVIMGLIFFENLYNCIILKLLMDSFAFLFDSINRFLLLFLYVRNHKFFFLKRKIKLFEIVNKNMIYSKILQYPWYLIYLNFLLLDNVLFNKKFEIKFRVEEIFLFKNNFISAILNFCKTFIYEQHYILKCSNKNRFVFYCVVRHSREFYN